ncbi:MAG: hypothetical protein WBQ17_04845 [Rhizomicrobium sp.]
MSNDAKAGRLIAMAERLTDALKADIAALERGRPREMRSIETDMLQLAALFGRESAAFTVAMSKTIPAATRGTLIEVTKHFKDALAAQTRLVMRTKTISEGMIHAIAEDVARKRSAAKPYAPTIGRPRSPGAMVYNRLA